MEAVYPDCRAADVVVFVSLMYSWAVSGQLKCALDRLFAVRKCDPAWATPKKETVLRMASEGDTPETMRRCANGMKSSAGLGWTDRGQIVARSVLKVGDIAGHPALAEAHALGAAL